MEEIYLVLGLPVSLFHETMYNLFNLCAYTCKFLINKSKQKNSFFIARNTKRVKFFYRYVIFCFYRNGFDLVSTKAAAVIVVGLGCKQVLVASNNSWANR